MSDRIGREYYDSTDYFEGGSAAHIADLDSPFQRYRVRKVLEIHPPLATDRVVDLGCGWGTFGFALADRVGEVVGVDFSRKSIEICERGLAEWQAARQPDDAERGPSDRDATAPNLRFVCADAGDTGLRGASFDLVIAADLFEHLYPDDSVRVAREAYRLLVPGGRFATWTPHRGHVLEVLKNRDVILRRDPTHVDYKSMDAMKRLLSDAGFAIERAYYAESHLPLVRVAERLLQGAVPLLRRRIAVLGRKPHEST